MIILSIWNWRAHVALGPETLEQIGFGGERNPP
jgi:hypothetical protein